MLELDLSGDVQHRRAGRQSLEERAGRIGGRRASTGESDAEPARDASVAVRHIDRSSLTARRHEAYAAARAERIENRHVVNADDSKGMAHLPVLEKPHQQIPDRRIFFGADAALLGGSLPCLSMHD